MMTNRISATSRVHSLPASATRPGSKTVFAALVALGLGVASAFSQGYYPPANSPIDGNGSLLYIEDLLDGTVGNGNTSTGTLIVPAPSGKTVATDEQIADALQAAVQAAVGGTAPDGVTIYSLVNEASKYRSAKTGDWMTAATTAILTDSNAMNVLANLEAATAAAVQPNAKGASKVVKNAIKLIATPGSAAASDADDIVEQAVINAAAYADKIVASALSSAKKIDGADIIDVQKDIVSEAVQEALAAGASHLLEEILTAAEKGRASKSGVTSGDIVAAAFKFRGGASTGLPATKEDAAAVAGGAMRGAGSDEVGNIVTAVNTATASAFSAYITKVGEGFTTVAASSDPAVSGPALALKFTAANKDFIPALLTGGLSALNRIDTGVIAQALTSDDTNGGAATVQEIVRAAVRAVQKDAAKIAVAALDAANANITISKINQGAAEGATIALIGSVVSKTIKANVTATNTQGAVDGALRGAISTGKAGAVADVLLQATKASKLGNEAVDQGISTLKALNQEGIQYVAVLGAMAGNKATAGNVRLHAEVNPDLDAGQRDAITAGAAVLLAVQSNKNNFFNATVNSLKDDQNDTQLETEAIVLGAALANPKVSGAIASAAIANTSFSPAAIIAAAENADRKHLLNIQLATNAASFAKTAPDVVALFDYVNHTVFQNQKLAADITTGATVAAPQYAHRIGHAAAFAAPKSAAKVVSTLFAYSQLTSNTNNPVAAAAAITAGFTDGILEAKLESKNELAALKASVSAAVKAAMLLTGNGGEGTDAFRQSDGTSATTFNSTKQTGPAGVVTGYISQELGSTDVTIPGGETGTVAAIITAAVKSAKKYALEIAQAAAQAARSISPVFNDNATIVAAVSAANSKATSSQIAFAVQFGINEAAAGRPGAGAAGVNNYTQNDGAGDPVTSLFNL